MIDAKLDCRHFKGDKPCVPHKEHGVICNDCNHYDKIGKRILLINLEYSGDVLRTRGGGGRGQPVGVGSYREDRIVLTGSTALERFPCILGDGESSAFCGYEEVAALMERRRA